MYPDCTQKGYLEQTDFSSALENLSLEKSPDKGMTAQITSLNKTFTEFKKNQHTPLQSRYSMGQATWGRKLELFKKKHK